MNKEDLSNRFTYHPPLPNQPERYEAIRDFAHSFSIFLKDMCPDSRELSLSITHLEEVVFWANAAISRNEKESDHAKG